MQCYLRNGFTIIKRDKIDRFFFCLCVWWGEIARTGGTLYRGNMITNLEAKVATEVGIVEGVEQC